MNMDFFLKEELENYHKETDTKRAVPEEDVDSIRINALIKAVNFLLNK